MDRAGGEDQEEARGLLPEPPGKSSREPRRLSLGAAARSLSQLQEARQTPRPTG